MAGNARQSGRSVISKLSAIILTFAEGGEHTLSEIADHSGLPMSTTHRLTTELAAWRVLERDQNGGRFRPGPSLRALGGGSSCCTSSIRERAAPLLDDLCRVTGRDVRLGVIDGGVLSYIEKVPDQPVTQFSPAATLPMHATALGKMLLAFASPQFVDMALASRLRAYTARTVTDPERIRWNLKVARAHRMAVSEGELQLDYSAVAAPVFGPGGNAVASIEVRVDDLSAEMHVVRAILVVAAGSLSRELDRACDRGVAAQTVSPASTSTQLARSLYALR
jgi:DNA-binding IclR family transcriptional regulator